MPFVERRTNESMEQLLRRFRRQLQESGTLRTFRRTRFFTSKGELRRDKQRRAARRLLQRQRRMRERLGR